MCKWCSFSGILSLCLYSFSMIRWSRRTLSHWLTISCLLMGISMGQSQLIKPNREAWKQCVESQGGCDQGVIIWQKSAWRTLHFFQKGVKSLLEDKCLGSVKIWAPSSTLVSLLVCILSGRRLWSGGSPETVGSLSWT